MTLLKKTAVILKILPRFLNILYECRSISSHFERTKVYPQTIRVLFTFSTKNQNFYFINNFKKFHYIFKIFYDML